MLDESGGLARSHLTFLSRSRGLRAAALLAVLGACSSSLAPGGAGGSGSGDAGSAGTGAAGTGGTGGGCAHPAPTDSPFDCAPTYAEGFSALCAAQPQTLGVATKQLTGCDSFRVLSLGNPFWVVSCIYDGNDALVGAAWCGEGTSCDGKSCIESAGLQNLQHCGTPLNVCGGGSAGAGGSTAGSAGTGAAGTGGTGGAAGCADRAPADPPFYCKPTYAEQLPALCALQTGHAGETKRASTCGSFQRLSLETNFYGASCFYDSNGTLVGARRCEDSLVYCGSPCIESAGSPSLTSCDSGWNPCGGGGAGGAAGAGTGGSAAGGAGGAT